MYIYIRQGKLPQIISISLENKGVPKLSRRERADILKLAAPLRSV